MTHILRLDDCYSVHQNILPPWDLMNQALDLSAVAIIQLLGRTRFPSPVYSDTVSTVLLAAHLATWVWDTFEF